MKVESRATMVVKCECEGRADYWEWSVCEFYEDRCGRCKHYSSWQTCRSNDATAAAMLEFMPKFQRVEKFLRTMDSKRENPKPKLRRAKRMAGR